MATTTRRPEGFAVSFKGEGALGAGSSGWCGQNLFQHAGDKIENDWWFEEHLDYDFPYVGNVIILTIRHIFQRGRAHPPGKWCGNTDRWFPGKWSGRIAWMQHITTYVVRLYKRRLNRLNILLSCPRTKNCCFSLDWFKHKPGQKIPVSTCTNEFGGFCEENEGVS